MPCFKGIAVSIHANGSPLPEYGVQRQSRLSRISNYIPVPQPSLNGDSNKPEPAKFAISITLLTPGLPIPYSAPKPSDTNPYPKAHFVGGLHPVIENERGKFFGIVTPYIPMTNSENETIAAYIYFDGRAKEEVATLLRPGEETWVNSRWVQVPESEGGGLAEREFLFREVGLERWLNGLDLQGHDAAEKLERRRQKFEKRQRRQNRTINGDAGTDAAGTPTGRKDTLRYGADDTSPIEAVFDSDSWSDDDDGPPEATGQIKVAMFRVLASGEIKKGEYSPQFDAHDGDDETAGGADNGINADVEHTTSFFYRGERQLQKIGVMQSSKNTQATPGSVKRRSGQLDFSSLGPLKAGGTVGFTAFRDQEASGAVRRRKARKKSNGHIADDSDDDDDDDDDGDEIVGKMEDLDDREEDGKLTEDDPKFGGDLADGVNRIRLKRAHSTEPESASTPEASQRAAADGSPPSQGKPRGQSLLASQGGAVGDAAEAIVGSPLKRARPTVGESSVCEEPPASQSLSAAVGAAPAGSSTTDAMTTTTTKTSSSTTTTTDGAEEEL